MGGPQGPGHWVLAPRHVGLLLVGVKDLNGAAPRSSAWEASTCVCTWGLEGGAARQLRPRSDVSVGGAMGFTEKRQVLASANRGGAIVRT